MAIGKFDEAFGELVAFYAKAGHLEKRILAGDNSLAEIRNVAMRLTPSTKNSG